MSGRRLPRAVIYLGLASLFTDISGEAVYPLFPTFLTHVLGASVFFVGLFEGAAESVSSIAKYFSGAYSDRMENKESLVLGGYAVANTVRPLIGLCSAPWQAFALRFIDRAGKGVRSSPRDSWLARLATPETRGRVFGYHAAMDHAGAVLGPLLAAGFLGLYPDRYRALFLMTLVPGWITLVFIALAARARDSSAPTAESTQARARIPGVSGRARSFRLYLVIVGVFTLGNSSDAFLLLKLQDAGVAVRWIPALWAAFHVVKMSSSVLGGHASDRYGRKALIIGGWALYAAAYAALAKLGSAPAVIAIFLAYGLYYGLTESPEKALVADLAPPEERGAAFGLYNLVVGIGALPASLVFGWLWQAAGPAYAFSTGAALAAASCLALLALPLGTARGIRPPC